MAGEADGVSKVSSLSQRWPRVPLFLQAGRKAALGAPGGGIFTLLTDLVHVFAYLVCLCLIHHLGHPRASPPGTSNLS